MVSEKNFLLTKAKIHDIITTKDEAKENAKKPERKCAMKKATLESIRDTLIDLGVKDTDPMVVELNAELSKGAEEKAARAAQYEGIHSLIVDNLSDTPISCADLCLEIAHELESHGMTRHNVQYALNNLWQDEIVKIPGKPNTYRRA